MNVTYLIYRFLTTCLFFLVFPLLKLIRISGAADRSINQRFGYYDSKVADNNPGFLRIWIHAASVGEVGVAENIICKLMTMEPSVKIIFSTTSKTGQALAQDKLGAKVICVYAPLDFMSCVEKSLQFFKPNVIVFVETEIWPNWLYSAQEMGVKTMFVNGRISVRSIKKYIMVKSLFKNVLEHVDAFSMISEDDAARIRLMGAPEERIVINGNAKYDSLINTAGPDNRAKIDDLMNLNGGENVFVAGCTHNSEEEIILDVYGKICENFPETILIIAPRHVERAGQIEKLVNDRGFLCQLRTDLDNGKRTSPVVIIDTIGELQDIYSIASIVFCGGSLASFGGHNILEPAAWSKPVLYGPFMEDFLDAQNLLEQAGGSIQVKNGKDLSKNALFLLSHPDKAKEMGKAAKRAALSNRSAAKKHAEVIVNNI